jgi:4-amino-4-deoxy-L-arabinose transferase-like glycosyltransferase
LLICVLLVAAGLRLLWLDTAPPGFYRDEAFNGQDALAVLAGENALYFPANNGREPAYIYLTALSVSVLGRTVTAVRLAAAVVGTLTTIPLFLLARSWFGWRVGLLAAWLWAVTLWPVHLSRIGLRPVILAPLLALTFWLGTLAYRRQKGVLWLLSGMLYGLCFYTYLTALFTPLLLGMIGLFLLWRPQTRRRLWPGVLWFLLGAGLLLAPLGLLAIQQPDLVLGRTGQVSILNPAINNGDFWGTLARQTGRALGMYLWRGDTIWRHNPAGRPVFDWVMLIPFIIGVVVIVRRWRRPAMFALLAWSLIMLGPTILAEDAPHFLRAAGVLPTILIIPALGLSRLLDWPKLPTVLYSRQRRWRVGLIGLLCVATLVVTVRDYFGDYARRAETAFYFEAAARDLAMDINTEADDTTVYLDEQYGPGAWPAVSFLVDPAVRPVTAYAPAAGLPCPATCTPPFTVYAWPYTALDYVSTAIPVPVIIRAETGSLAMGDRETEPYPFYARYQVDQVEPDVKPAASFVNFDHTLHLISAATELVSPAEISLTLVWQAPDTVDQPLTAFVHVVDSDGAIVAQSDRPPGGPIWPHSWWQPGRLVVDERRVVLPQPFDRTQQSLIVGLYNTATGDRLPVRDETGQPAGDSWPLDLQN